MTGGWDVALIAAKAATYAATLGAAGACWFLRYMRDLLGVAESRKIGRLVFFLSVLALLTSALQIPLSGAAMADAAAGVFDVSLLTLAWQSGIGAALLLRFGGLALARFKRTGWPAALGAALATVSFLWTGHARSLGPAAMFLHAIHLLAAAFWLGALVPLWIVTSTDASRLAVIAARFGRLAVWVVGGLLTAGLVLLWLLLGRLDALWESGYGRFVLAKLALVALLLGCAAFNKLRLTPRLSAGEASTAAHLRGSIVAELILACSILAVTATFTSLTGPPTLE